MSTEIYVPSRVDKIGKHDQQKSTKKDPKTFIGPPTLPTHQYWSVCLNLVNSSAHGPTKVMQWTLRKGKPKFTESDEFSKFQKTADFKIVEILQHSLVFDPLPLSKVTFKQSDFCGFGLFEESQLNEKLYIYHFYSWFQIIYLSRKQEFALNQGRRPQTCQHHKI